MSDTPPLAVLPDGAWPVMLTPFHPDRSIDWDAVDDYASWLIDLGAAGLFTVALSGEMYDVTPAERHALLGRVAGVAERRVPVIASAIAASPEAIADECLALAAAGADAVVLITGLLATPEEPDSAWIEAVETVLARTGDLDLGVYECPLPYRRLLSLDALRWLAGTGRFVFLKDTCQRSDLHRARIAATAESRLKHFNAQACSLRASLAAGGHGSSGFVSNLYPELVAWLCAHHADAPEADVLAVQRALSVVEHAIDQRYPSSAKYLLAHSSRLRLAPISRWRHEPIGEPDGAPLVDLARFLETAGLPALDVARR